MTTVAPTSPAPATVVETSLAKTTDVRGMFDRIAGRYDAANRVMSAGIDVLLRRQALGVMLDRIAANPRLLDLGAGALDGALALRRGRPGARVVAAGFARELVEGGRRQS